MERSNMLRVRMRNGLQANPSPAAETAEKKLKVFIGKLFAISNPAQLENDFVFIKNFLQKIKCTSPRNKLSPLSCQHLFRGFTTSRSENETTRRQHKKH